MTEYEFEMWKVILKQNREKAWKCRVATPDMFLSGVLTPVGNVATLICNKWWDDLEGDEVVSAPTITGLNEAKGLAMLNTLPDEDEAREVQVARARGKMVVYCGLSMGEYTARRLAEECGFKRAEAVMCGDDAPYLVKLLGVGVGCEQPGCNSKGGKA